MTSSLVDGCHMVDINHLGPERLPKKAALPEEPGNELLMANGTLHSVGSRLGRDATRGWHRERLDAPYFGTFDPRWSLTDEALCHHVG